MPDPKPWTLEEITAYAARHGLGALDNEALERMRLIADKVTLAGTTLPRPPRKDDEPASVFQVPL